MPRTVQLQAGESLEEFAKRLGITLDELARLNPGLNEASIIEGFALNVPDTVASSVVAPPAGQAFVPGVSKGVETPTGTTTPGTEGMTEDAAGLFQTMLADFTKAFQTFVTAPGFIRNLPTARAGAEAGKGVPGFSQQEAAFLREMEPELYERYGEAVQRQFAITGKIPTLMPADFLKTISVREMMEMAPPGTVRGQRRYGPPSITPRRLRF